MADSSTSSVTATTPDSSLDLSASRRYRTAFTREQVGRLETEFLRENYVSRPRRGHLAAVLGLPEATIKVWFQNRRMKDKRQRMALSWPYWDTSVLAPFLPPSGGGGPAVPVCPTAIYPLISSLNPPLNPLRPYPPHQVMPAHFPLHRHDATDGCPQVVGVPAQFAARTHKNLCQPLPISSTQQWNSYAKVKPHDMDSVTSHTRKELKVSADVTWSERLGAPECETKSRAASSLLKSGTCNLSKSVNTSQDNLPRITGNQTSYRSAFPNMSTSQFPEVFLPGLRREASIAQSSSPWVRLTPLCVTSINPSSACAYQCPVVLPFTFSPPNLHRDVLSSTMRPTISEKPICPTFDWSVTSPLIHAYNHRQQVLATTALGADECQFSGHNITSPLSRQVQCSQDILPSKSEARSEHLTVNDGARSVEDSRPYAAQDRANNCSSNVQSVENIRIPTGDIASFTNSPDSPLIVVDHDESASSP